MAKAAPAGSLCWCRGCPSVNGNAGAGLGPPGRAARCSAQARRQAGFKERVRLASEFNSPHIFRGGGDTEVKEGFLVLVCCYTTNVLDKHAM